MFTHYSQCDIYSVVFVHGVFFVQIILLNSSIIYFHMLFFSCFHFFSFCLFLFLIMFKSYILVVFFSKLNSSLGNGKGLGLWCKNYYVKFVSVFVIVTVLNLEVEYGKVGGGGGGFGYCMLL